MEYPCSTVFPNREKPLSRFCLLFVVDLLLPKATVWHKMGQMLGEIHFLHPSGIVFS
jgi:hypothetical protein